MEFCNLYIAVYNTATTLFDGRSKFWREEIEKTVCKIVKTYHSQYCQLSRGARILY